MIKIISIMSLPEEFSEIIPPKEQEKEESFFDRNIKFLQKKGIIADAEKLKEIYAQNQIKETLTFARPENFEYVLQMYGIKTMKELEEFCKKREINWMLQYTPPENLISFLKKFKIEKPEQFEQIPQKPKIRNILWFIRPENFQEFLKVFQSQEFSIFEQFCQEENIEKILSSAKPENLKGILKRLKIEKPDDFKKLSDNKEIIWALQHSLPQNLQQVLTACEIKTFKDFETLCQESEIKNILKHTSPENLQWTLKFYEINDLKSFEKLLKKNNVVSIIKEAQFENLMLVLKSLKIETPEQFEELCDVYNIKWLLAVAQRENLNQIIKIFQIEKIEQLETFSQKEELLSPVKEIPPSKFQWALRFYEIENQKDILLFEKFCERLEVQEVIKNTPIEILEEIKQKGEKSLFDEKIKEKAKIIYQFLIEKHILENLKQAKGDYFARFFPNKIISFLSSKLLENFIEYQKKENEQILAEKKPEFLKKIKHHHFNLRDVLLGKKALKRLIEENNFAYLSAMVYFKDKISPFDYYGILGKNFEEIKGEIDNLATTIIEKDLYEKHKEEYLLHLPSLLGYGMINPKLLNEILREEDILSFKFKKADLELKKIIEQIKDIEYLPAQKNTFQIEILKISIFHLKKSFQSEVENIKNNLSKLKNQSEGEKIIKEIEGIIQEAESLLEKMKENQSIIEEKNSLEKRINNLLSKRIINQLKMTQTRDDLLNLKRKLEKEKISPVQKVEILKNAPEMFSAINIEPSCERVGSEYQENAFTIVQGPVIIIGAKNIEGKIIGRMLLLPVKKIASWDWVLEAKTIYGKGEKEIEEYLSLLENILGRDKITKKIVEGELPPMNTEPSNRITDFYRDEMGTTRFPK